MQIERDGVRLRWQLEIRNLKMKRGEGMEIYRIQQTDMMGFTMKEEFFINQGDAIKRFDETMEEYRQNEDLASDEDAIEEEINKEAITVSENKHNSIKEATVCLWSKCSYEYDDWEIVAEHLKLEKIEVKEGKK